MAGATIGDVAAQAGVSKATVSAVLNGRPNVSDATRSRIQSIIREMNYRPRGAARQLGRHKQVPTLGLVVKEITNPYYAELIAGVRACASERGYLLVVSDSDRDADEERAVCSALQRHGVDGLIISPTLTEAADFGYLYELQRANFPFVLIGSVTGVRASSVSIDNQASARSGVDHLIRSGIQRIFHLAGPDYSLHSRQRVEGVQQAFGQSSLVYDPSVVVPCGSDIEDGRRAAAGLLQRLRDAGVPPSAEAPIGLSCYNDMVALGAWGAVQHDGYDVPGEVALIGHDGIELAGALPTPLSTVRSPNKEMGRRAAEMLIDHLDGHVEVERVLMDTELVLRASTPA